MTASPSPETTKSDALYVAFTVGSAHYVVPASDVLEMESFTEATSVPGAAPWVAGLVQIRGRVIPVIDLRARFGLPAIAHTLDHRVIVVREGKRHVGLLADSAREVLRLAESSFVSPPDVVVEQSAGFVDRIARLGERILMRIDFTKVIGHDALPKEQSDGDQA